MEVYAKKLRRQAIKLEILEKTKLFVNEEEGVFDVKAFFKANQYYKNKITYYFGSLSEFYEEVGARPDYKYVRAIKEKLKKKRTMSVRNELALERLRQLRREGKTLQEIGDSYGVTKQAIEQLAYSLDIDLI